MRTQSRDMVDVSGGDQGLLIWAAVAAQSSRTPDTVALRDIDGATLTYRALVDRVELLAGVLVASGVGLGDLVGVCLERGENLIVSALAVLRTGGGYLPLDPSHPVRRLRTVLDDAEPRVVVTDSQHREAVESAGATALDLDVDLHDSPRAAPPCPVGPSDTAYVIYTSGSTGKPKGVIVTHDALRELLRWMSRDFPLAADSRVIVNTAPTFDVSIAELFWPLVNGAELVVPAAGAQYDPERFAEGIRELRATDMFMVPSQLSAFLTEPTASRCRTVRRVILIGEQFQPTLLRRLTDVWPAAEVINSYGPTEAAVVNLWHRCTPDDTKSDLVPIGGPAGDNTVRIVRPGSLDPVEDGVGGELLLGGPQLAVGYHHRQALTDDVFVTTPDERLYRTGDMVRRRSDGAIEFLGRGDRQVKVRGHRIELGDVETALLAEDFTRYALADLREHPADGNPVLVAWVQVEPEATERQVRDALSTRLPRYMIPDAVTVVPEIPLLPNGKLDRKALPEPFGQTTEPAVPDTPTALCATIQDTWEQLSGIRTGRDEGFLQSGGNSLLLLKLRAKLRELGHDRLRVLDFMEHPTPGALAEYLAKPSGTAQTSTW